VRDDSKNEEVSEKDVQKKKQNQKRAWVSRAGKTVVSSFSTRLGLFKLRSACGAEGQERS